MPPDTLLALAAERAAIEKAQSNINAITTQHALTFKVKRPDAPTRASEKNIAHMIGDDELLKHGSFKIKDEVRSDDDEAEVTRELDVHVAARRLFNPKANIPVRTAEGYVMNAFVVPDNVSDHGDDGGLNRSQDSTENDGSDGEDGVDDSDSDWNPSESSTPSASKKRGVRISKADMAAFQAFKAQQQAHQTPAGAAAQSPTHSPKNASISGSPRPRRSGSPAQPMASIHGAPTSTAPSGFVPADLVMSLLQSQSAHRPAEPSVDQHLRMERDMVMDFAIPLPPPEHGEWDDIEHLLNKFLPAYERYKHSSKRGYHQSIWELYTPTQRRKIAKLLSETPDDVTVQATYDALAHLTDEAFMAELCAAKGHSTSTLTEIALRAIKFKGKLTEKVDWVNHETAWEDCLRKCSANGTVEPKRLFTIYRESIPDPYFQTALLQRKFSTWKEAHAYLLLQLKNTDFIIPYHDACMKRMEESKRSHEEHKSSPAKPRQTDSTPRDATRGASGGSSSSAPAPDAQGASSDFNPLTFKNSYGAKNVNPNMKKDFTLNKDNAPCTRCGRVHKWLADMCTEREHKDGTALDMAKEEITARMLARWTAGFFFKKRLAAAFSSPSVQDSAAAASQANQAIHGGRGGGAARK